MPTRRKKQRINEISGSTAPWDQSTYGTTITHWENDPVPGMLSQEDAIIHSRVPTVRLNLGKRENGTIMLVSRKNLDYKQS